jgi:hypothetical protein
LSIFHTTIEARNSSIPHFGARGIIAQTRNTNVYVKFCTMKIVGKTRAHVRGRSQSLTSSVHTLCTFHSHDTPPRNYSTSFFSFYKHVELTSSCCALATSTMHEIVTLQFGERSNYLGTHYWNTQVRRQHDFPYTFHIVIHGCHCEVIVPIALTRMTHFISLTSSCLPHTTPLTKDSSFRLALDVVI